MPNIAFTGKVSDFLKIGVAAAARGDLGSVKQILKQRPDWIHRVGSHGRTMLWEACHRGKFEMVKYLIRRKANIDACGSHYTPYFVDVSCYCIARFKKRAEVAEYLLGKNAKLDIHTAAFLGDIPAVKKYLRSRKRLDAGHPQYEMAPKNDEGLEFIIAPTKWATPLCYALRGGNKATVEYLIDQGARIKGIEKQLFIAANDDPVLVEMLLKNGADPKHAPTALPDDKELYDVVSKYGVKQTSRKELNEELVYLCRGDRGGNPESVKELLAAGANVNHHDHKGKTALHRAAKAGFEKTMEILLAHGAKVDAVDLKGETPLFDTVRSTIKDTRKRNRAIRLLIQHGAKPDHENNRQLSVRDVARKLNVRAKWS